MSKSAMRFDPAPDEVYDLMRSVIGERFPEIRDLQPELRITILMASNGGEVFVPALKHHGTPAVAMIKRSNAEDRALDGPDILIEIDQNRWDERGERGRCAILAHELRHIEFKRDKGGVIKYDAYDRPQIKLVPDDWTLTGFRDVAEWYGEDAAEVQAVRNVVETIQAVHQLDLPFMDADSQQEAETVSMAVDEHRNGNSSVRPHNARKGQPAVAAAV